MKKLARLFGLSHPRLQRILETLDRPATARFLAIALAVVWFASFAAAVCRREYRSFDGVCNHDLGAVLRVDEVIAQGFRPGIDFFYYYGLLPLAVCHAFFGVVGRSPISLILLMFVLSSLLYVGVAWVMMAFHPTRLGALLLAIAAGHVTNHLAPTHAMEAAVLVGAIGLRLRGHSLGAIALATIGLFTKMSMATVLLGGFAGLIVLDALRTRRIQPLSALLAFPVVFGVGAGLSIAWLGAPAFAGGFDARAGAAIYRAWNLGFLREGRGFWHPAGHNLNWYLGSIAGPWCLGSLVLLFLAIRGVVRLLRATIHREAHNGTLMSEELYALAGFGNLAFVVGFYGPSLYVLNYAWLLLIGFAPIIGPARLGVGDQADDSLLQAVRRLGWLPLGVFLLLSQVNTLKAVLASARTPRVTVGQVTMPLSQADELAATLALGHSVGGGVVTAIGHTANFGLVDPTIRQGHYWMLVHGMPKTKALEETLELAKSSDVVLVTKPDYPTLRLISEFKPLLENSERLHDGKHFLLLRSPKREQEL